MSTESILQFKVCMLGVFAVGKTSLVARYVHGIFSDRYLATLGVKIDRRELVVDGKNVRLMLWDMAGEDEFSKINLSFLRGAAGYLLVLDGTSRATVSQSIVLHRKTQEVVGPLPYLVLLNKSDLEREWEITEADRGEMAARAWPVHKTSARSGEGVEAAFRMLTEKMMMAAAAQPAPFEVPPPS